MFPTFIGILDIQSWWEVPSIAHFCSLFRAAFNLLDFDIEDLEEALLTDGGAEGRLLQELIVRLLEGCLPNESRNDISTFNYQMFLRRLFRKKCQDYKYENPFNTDVDFELLPLRQKVEILRSLCDFRLDAEDVEQALANLDSYSLRVEPLGHDRSNSAYWYFYGTRLYREDYITPNKVLSPRQNRRGRDKKRKKRRVRGEKLVEKEEEEEEEEEENETDHLIPETIQDSPTTVWQVVCFTQQDWSRLVDKFKDSEYDTERKLYHTLSEDFLPEIPKLFELKEKQQRRRLLERNTRVQRGQEPAEPTEQAIMVRAKMKTKAKATRKNQSTRNEDSDEETPPPAPPQKKGRQTNNSLASADGQIVIHTRDELEAPKKGLPKHTSTYVSSYPYTFGIEEEERRVGMHKVLESLKDHEDAWPFVDPVDEEYAPRYYSVVRKPMDLTTMEEKLEGGSYKNLSQFKRDFTLIVDNCRQYNGSENEYTEMAVTLKEAFDRAVDRYLESEPSSDEYPSVPASPNAVPPSPHPARASSSPLLSCTRKRNKKSKQKSKSNKSEKKGKDRVRDDGDDDDEEEEEEEEKEEEEEESPRDKRNKKRSRRAREEEERNEDNDEDDENGAISESSVIKTKRKKYSEVEKLLPKSRKLLAKEEKYEESNKRGKTRQKVLVSKREHREGRESRRKKEDFEENHEPLVNVKGKSKRIEKRGVEEAGSTDRSKKKQMKKQEKIVDESDDERLLDIGENGEVVSDRKRNRRKERSSQKQTKVEVKRDRKGCKEKEKKSKAKRTEERPKNGEIKKVENVVKKEDTASKKFDSLVSNKDLESLDSLKDRISERRREDKLKMERERAKRSGRIDNEKKKVPSNGNTYHESGKVNLKRAKLRKPVKDDKVLAIKDEPVEIKKPKLAHGKHGKNREESPAIQALNQATEQTLNDINKWLDDTPKLSEFSSGGDSPQTKQPSTSEVISRSGKIEVARKRPTSVKFLGPNGPPRPKKVQRTIDRLQPGKAKGNLLLKKPLSSGSNSVDTPASQSTSDVDHPSKDSTDEPKLSLGTVLKNSDSIQLMCKSLVSSPNPNLSNDDDEDDRSVVQKSMKIEDDKSSTTKEETPKIDSDDSKQPEKIHKPKSATPNLSAWFKAFGAPKSKKKEEEPEEIPKKEEFQEALNSIPQRQRRLSAGGSSVSESVSSFSQESPPGLTIRSPQSQPALTPTAIEQPIRAGFYQDALSTGSSPNNSPYYATPPRYSAQLPPTPSPQNYSHPLSPAYPSSATYDQNPLYPQIQPPHQIYQKPVTPENPPETYPYPQNSPQNPLQNENYINPPQLPNQKSPVYPQPSPQALPVYPQTSPQPPPSNYSQPSPQQPTTPNYSQPSPQQPAANYSQPSPQNPPTYSQPSPQQQQQQQHSPYSQPSPQQPNSPYSQPLPSPKPPPTYSQVSPQPPPNYSQPSPQFAQPSPQPPPNYSQPSPQNPSNYSQPSPGSRNYSQHSPQPPPNYSQPSPQSLNYSQPSPQPPPNYSQHSPQQAASSTGYTAQVSPQPGRIYPQPSPQPCVLPPVRPANYSQPSTQTTPQTYQKPEDYPSSGGTYPQGFKSNHSSYIPPASVPVEPERRIEYLKPEEKLPVQQMETPRSFTSDPPIGLNPNHQVYQSNQFPPAYGNNYPPSDSQRPPRLTQETPQQPQDRHFDPESLKYTQRQDQSQLLSFQQSIPGHDTIYQAAGGFQAPPYPMPNPSCRPVYPSPHYYDASAKTSSSTSIPPTSVATSLAPVKKRMYNEPTSDSTRSLPDQPRGNQDQFGYDQMMTLATSESGQNLVSGQFDGGFGGLDTVAGNSAYARLGLGLVGRTPKDQQQLLSIPRPSSKDALSYRQPGASELDLNLLQSLQNATAKTMPAVHSRRDPATAAPATKGRKSKKKGQTQGQQQQNVNEPMTGFPQYSGNPGEPIGLKNPPAIPPGGSAFNFATPAGATNSSPYYDKDASAAAAAFAFLDEFRNPNNYYSILRQQQGQPQATPVTEAGQQAKNISNQPPRNYPPHPFLHSTQRSAPYGPPVSAYVSPHGPNLGVDPAAYSQYIHSLYALQPPSHHHRPSWL